ncbi:MAG: MraY family glycosyltransferase [Betaproteobacteria bacterium]
MEPGAAVQLFAPVLAGILSLAALFFLLKSRGLPLDHPNQRSLHNVPVPRTGGIAVMIGVLAAALVLRADAGLIIPAAVLAVVSYVDDRHALSAPTRLTAHLAAAAIFLWAAGISGNWIVLVALCIAIGWLTNLYNFMDGADGLAGGMAVIGFAAYGFAAIAADMQALSLLAFSIGAAAAGFLIFNFPPARIFLGDAGSIPLGFLAGALGVLGWQREAWPIWYPLVVFAPFIIDASVTLARRLLHGERIWQAHREHYYQKLILSGWSHRKTAIWEYALMLACATLALAAREAAAPRQAAAVVVAIAAFAGCAVWIDRRWAHHAR